MPVHLIVIGGIPVPDDRPIFLPGLTVHVATAAACVLASAVAPLPPQRPGRHPAPAGPTTGR
ncbi:MAG TPA: hypothetical protein VGJ13_04765 [Pseudonocardiaceae bacterium]